MKTISTFAPLLLLIFACRMCSLSGNTVNPRDLDPYKGSLQALIPKEASTGVVKFKLVNTKSTTFKGTTEAVQADYTMEAGPISTPVTLIVANFPSTQAATDAIPLAAAEKHATLTSKTKSGTTVGQRFTDQDGKAIVWTNGSLLCISFSQLAKPASNLEEALPF